MSSQQQYHLATEIRDECIRTALAAYESAAMSGLCGEGAFEAAISAMRMLDVKPLVEQRAPGDAVSQ